MMDKTLVEHQSEHQVLSHIQDLVTEEHRLLEHASLAEVDHARLTRLQAELDQCWDLLRQRRALREVGGNPEQAEIRPPGVVEKYVG